MSESSIKEPVYIDSLKVIHDGRITIPQSARDEAGLMPRQKVDLVIILEDGSERQFTRPIDTQGRITIPARVRDRFEIEEGDYIDARIESN